MATLSRLPPSKTSEAHRYFFEAHLHNPLNWEDLAELITELREGLLDGITISTASNPLRQTPLLSLGKVLL